MVALRAAVPLALLLVTVVAIGGAGHAAGPLVVLGADAVEYAGGDPPNCFGPSILFDYGQPGVRSTIRDQLAAMRAAGLESLRVFVVFDHDVSENRYFAPARTGRLEEPFRTNLVNYLADITAAGFRRVTLAFDARYSVDPFSRFGPYDPATFDETWNLIRDTRPLLKRYGPSETRVDLLNEGAPPATATAEMISWVRRMYSNYVDEFGANDVTISAGSWTGLATLVDVLRSTGRSLPRWFDVHPRYEHDTALEDLRRADADLKAAGLSQPLVVGEEKYNDPEVARTIREFSPTTGRTVEEVMEWPALAIGIGAQPRCISPPYRIDAYARELNGSAPSKRLTATLTDKTFSFSTAYGRSVTALEGDTYTLVVRDRSKLRGFSFAGMKTSTTFRGTRTRTVSLQPGSTVYRILGKRPRSGNVRVLAAG